MNLGGRHCWRHWPEDGTLPSVPQGLPPVVEELASPSHVGPVVGLATCIGRPIAISAGTDRSLRVWDYQEKTMELVSVLGMHARGFR